MHPALEQLQKIVGLEPGNGYSNKAVIGGLQKMLVFWEPNARRGGLPAEFIDSVKSQVLAYPDQDPAQRPATIQAIQDMIRAAAAAPPPAASAAPPRPAAPAAPRQPDAAQARRNMQTERPAAPAARPTAEDAATPSAAPAFRPPAPPPAAPVTRPPSAPTEPAPPAASPSSVEQSVKPRSPERSSPPPGQAPANRPQQPAGSRGNRPPKPAKPQVQQQPRARRPEVSDLDETPIDPRPRRAPAAARPLRSDEPLNKDAGLDAPLTVLHGVGPETAKDYERLGITTLRDLLLHFPRRYDDYSQLKTINRLEIGEECSVIATVWEAHVRPYGAGRKMLKVILSDPTGSLEVTFFNQDFLAKQFTPGRQIVISGRIDSYLGRLTIVPNEWEDLDRELLSTGRIVPVYRANADLRQKNIRKLTSQVVKYWAQRQPDPLPADIVASAGLMPYGEALAQVHFPDNQEKLAAARHRLAFDELLILQLGSLRQRRDWQADAAVPRVASDEWLQAYLASLPYTLTGAQQRAVADIRADLARAVPMNRLLQGDVGSGKTAVAAAAMAVTIQSGAQAAIMAPTSILAEQHYRTLATLLAPVLGGSPGALRLLQGSSTALEKEEVYAGLRSGEIKAVVGTHALIEGPVEFANLGLVIVDEQHRFGVAQRAALRGKGTHPHLLVMTATPIPRSLALTIYGDLDLSLLDEMPPGRQPITTKLLSATERERGYAYVRSQLAKGRQAFIIFPLVEESDKIDAKAAVAEHARLQKDVFGDYKLGLLHGRLKPDEKDAAMAAFHAGEYNVLVSTSVVEVGVDVPNATVILIEGANRFGLAQLHQFRGRVGRGEHASVCLLIADGPQTPGRKDERLQAMEDSQDGFYLAEKDLNLRGPGDFLGTRQSGQPLLMAKLTDLETIEKARRAARQLFERDPELQAPEHQALAQRFNQFWTPGSGDAS